jgi:hypothetical protein
VEQCSTTNIGPRAPIAPPIYLAAREGGPTTIDDRRPDQGAGFGKLGITFPHQGDLIPNILLIDLHTSYSTFISIIHSFKNQYIGHTVS